VDLLSYKVIRLSDLFVDDMGACRIYGSLKVNKVASNLHITSDGHGYGKFF
jgi:hypothetical protein